MALPDNHLLKILEEQLKLPGNQNCADCGQKTPKWSSTNLGLYMCMNCSGVHRHIGTNYSKVKSTNMDHWNIEQVNLMCSLGNIKANQFWEALLPSGLQRNFNTEDRHQFIINKYVKRLWVDPNAPVPYQYAPLFPGKTVASNANQVPAPSILPPISSPSNISSPATSSALQAGSPVLNHAHFPALNYSHSAPALIDLTTPDFISLDQPKTTPSFNLSNDIFGLASSPPPSPPVGVPAKVNSISFPSTKNANINNGFGYGGILQNAISPVPVQSSPSSSYPFLIPNSTPTPTPTPITVPASSSAPLFPAAAIYSPGGQVRGKPVADDDLLDLGKKKSKPIISAEQSSAILSLFEPSKVATGSPPYGLYPYNSPPAAARQPQNLFGPSAENPWG